MRQTKNSTCRAIRDRRAGSIIGRNKQSCMPVRNGISYVEPLVVLREDGSQMSDNIGRRDFLGAAAAAGVVMAAGGNALVDPAKGALATSDEIILKSAGELASAIRAKDLSSRTIVEAHLAQIAKVNPKLNAIVQLTADSARKEADEADAALARGESRGPLHGVPVTIKDTLERRESFAPAGLKAVQIMCPMPMQPP
jgi:hypothetical protein